MSLSLRYYQEEQVSATAQSIIDGLNPICASPTGSGKSLVLCGIVDEVISLKPTWNILILSHVKEILEQNHSALEKYFNIEIGLYSQGLNSKTIKKITVAGIQSANTKSSREKFEHFDLVLIDEAHRVSFDIKAGYRVFVNHIKAQACGLTATNYRTKGGYLHEGENSLFDNLASDWTQLEKFNQLTEDGFLSEIFSKKTALLMDTIGVKTLGGDFKSKDLSGKFDRENITRAAVMESIHFGKRYKAWLCFAIDIQHAENICKMLNESGVPSVAIHSKMEDRDGAIRDFKAGKYKCAVTVEVLTTGFDHPSIDFIIMLRPTKSPIIHVQTIGRGLRVVYADGFDLETREGRLQAIQKGPKQYCLVLDFAGNTKRLGPINDIRINTGKKKKGASQIMSKECPDCGIENHLAAKVCINCEFDFPSQEKINARASEAELVKKTKKKKPNVIEWAEVKSVEYNLHQKTGRPHCLKVTYKCGVLSFDEYILLDGHSYAKHKANNWIKFRWPHEDRIPRTVEELLMHKDRILKPKKILVDLTNRYPVILQSEF